MMKSVRPTHWTFRIGLTGLTRLAGLAMLLSILLTVPLHAARAAPEGGSEDGFFLEVAPLSVSVVQNNRVVGYLSVSYKLMVTDLADIARVANLTPRINDASIKILARIARTRLDVSKALNIELVRTYLQRTVDQVLGDGVATVLIQEASLQPG